MRTRWKSASPAISKGREERLKRRGSTRAAPWAFLGARSSWSTTISNPNLIDAIFVFINVKIN